MPSIPGFPDASVLITRTDNGKQLVFRKGEVRSTSNNVTSKSASITLDAQSSTDREVLNINLGQSRQLNFEFKLLFNNIDRKDNNGTHSFGDTIDYMENDIFFTGLGEKAKFQIEIADKFRYTKNNYILEDFAIDVDSGLYPTGNIKFNWEKKVV